MILNQILDNFKNAYYTLEQAENIRGQLTDEQRNIIQTFFHALRYRELHEYFLPCFGSKFEAFSLNMKASIYEKKHIASGIARINFYPLYENNNHHLVRALPELSSFLKAHKLNSISQKVLAYAQNTENLYTCFLNFNKGIIKENDISLFLKLFKEDVEALTLLLPTFPKVSLEQILEHFETMPKLLNFNDLEKFISPLGKSKLLDKDNKIYTLGSFAILIKNTQKNGMSAEEYIKIIYEQRKLESTMTQTIEPNSNKPKKKI